MIRPDPEFIRASAQRLGVTEEQAEALMVALKPLWSVLEDLAWTDAYGGAEFERVSLDVIETAHREANLPPPGFNVDTTTKCQRRCSCGHPDPYHC